MVHRFSRLPIFLRFLIPVQIFLIFCLFLTANFSIKPSANPKEILTAQYVAEPTSPAQRVYAIGDSITFGHRECIPTTASCVIESETFLYLYAKNILPENGLYGNFAGSGTTAAGSVSSPYTGTFKNTYINAETGIVNPISSQDINLTVNNMTGLDRMNNGIYKKIITASNAEVLVAYGRNDTDNYYTKIKIQDFKNALVNIGNYLKSNGTNRITFLTVPPIAKDWWMKYYPNIFTVRRTEFAGTNYNVFFPDRTYPVALDSFFSSQIWETAYETGSSLVPVHEYLRFHPDPQPQYFSTDGIHPSTEGHILLAAIISSEKRYVLKATTQNITLNGQFSLTSVQAGYGQVVYREDSGTFFASQPFKILPGEESVFTKLRNNTVIYSTVPVTVNPGADLTLIERYRLGSCAGKGIGACIFDTRSQFKISDGSYIESITAYGKGWNYDANGNPLSENGFDLMSVSRFAQGPCKEVVGICKFDTRSQFKVSSGALVESITAYGKGWNFDSAGKLWGSNNGFDLTTVARYSQGPCAGKGIGTCIFDTRSQFKVSSGALVESITAYGKGWNFDSAGKLWGSNNGFDLTTVARYSQGPCAGKVGAGCKFDTRSQFLINGKYVEAVTAYGRIWIW